MSRHALSFSASAGRTLRALAAVAALGAVPAIAAACSQSVSLGGGPKSGGDLESDRPVKIVHEPCEGQGGTDTNGDGKPDIVSVMSGSRETCRALDLNFDGRMDRWVYFDDQGNIRRIESDYDRDGRVDEIQNFRGGQLVRKDREMNLDGKLDTWDLYQDGKLVKRERDSDGDGKVDQWWTYEGDRVTIAMDRNGDGQPEPDGTIVLGPNGSVIAGDAGAVATAPTDAGVAPIPEPTPPPPAPSTTSDPSPLAPVDAGAVKPKRGGAKR